MNLTFEDDRGQKTVVPAAQDGITIGRGAENKVRLDGKDVSRRHARLVAEAGQVWLEDLSSLTGVRVNGEKVKGRRAVREGDVIHIGEARLSLEAEAPKPRPRPATSKPPPAGEGKSDKLAGDVGAVRAADPGRHLAEIEKPIDVPADKRPKLVGITAPFRGQEFELRKSPVRIGRDPENDLALDHPSLAPRHCRLHLDRRIWKVADTDGRNLPKVNGEPYVGIGLRHADVLEMGRLRFAFVAPGHLYKLPPETPVSPQKALADARARGRPVKIPVGPIAALLVLALGGFGVRYAIAHRKPAAPQPAPNATAAEVPPERRYALRAAEEAMAAHRYAEALRNLEQARRLGATAAELRGYERVKLEAHAEEQFGEMEAAATAQDWQRARRLLDGLRASHTHFGSRAASKADGITAGYVTSHLAAAALRKGKDDRGCLAEASLALQANPRSAEAKALAEECRAALTQVVQPPAVQASSIAPAQVEPAQPREVAPGTTAPDEGNDAPQDAIPAPVPTSAEPR